MAVTDGPVAAPSIAPNPGDVGDAVNTDESGERDRAWPAKPQVACAIALLVIVGFVVPIGISHAYGALGIVRNDDWSYLRTLFTWIHTGHLDFNNWVSMTLLMQLVFAAPIVIVFGHNITLIQLETATFGLSGLLLVLWIGFTLTRRLWFATFAGLLVAIGPLWGALTVSYMTDVPAFAVSMLACALGVQAFRRQTVSMPYLIASLTAGLVGFTIRQYAAVPPIAVAIIGGYLLWREGSKRRIGTFLVACAALLLGAIVFWFYWRTIPHPKVFSPQFPTSHSVKATLYKGTGLVRLVGLLVVPAVVLAGPTRILQRAWCTARDTTIFVVLGSAGVLAFTASAGPAIGFAGNYVTPSGILAQGVVAGHRPDILPSGMFVALLAIGSIADIFLALAIVPPLHELARRYGTRDFAVRDPVTTVIGLVVAGYCAAYFAAGITDIPLYDRYVLPVVPLVAILLLRRGEIPAVTDSATSRRSQHRLMFAGVAVLLAVAFIGTVYSVDSASFDGTRWKVAVDATEAGWSRHQVNGGFEWANFYGGGRYSGRKYCVDVTLNPPGGLKNPRIVSYAYYRSPLKEPVLVAAVRTKLPCKPALHPNP